MVSFLSIQDILLKLAAGLQEERITLGLTQAELAIKSNVSLSVLRKFERTGRISLESFTKLTYTLGMENELVTFFKRPSSSVSIDDILKKNKTKKRKRPYKPRKPKT